MIVFKSTFAKGLFSLGIATFLLAGAFGLSNFGATMSMDKYGNMSMSDCLMPGMTTVCSMSPLEHIATWQNTFLALLEQSDVFSLLLLLILAITVIGVGWLKQKNPPLKDAPQSFRRYLAQLYNFPATPLQELFSNGILNPKLF